MNRDEKRSLYSFLGLYIFSSFILLGVSAFWYYNAQKQMHENLLFYKMQSIAEKINAEVIEAHMQGHAFAMPLIEDAYSAALFSASGEKIYGSLAANSVIDFQKRYVLSHDDAVLVSTGTNMHLGIKYTVITSSILHKEVAQLRGQIYGALLAAGFFISLVGYMLLKIFMQPVKRRMDSMDRFIKDTAHELNTPITALMMSTRRAIEKGSYDSKLMRNISISTKQLYDLYTSLTYLSFDIDEEDTTIDLADSLRASMEYFNEQAQSKQIRLLCEKYDPTPFGISPHKALKLFNNLISNAIKYSHPDTTVTMRLEDGVFSIADEGIGFGDDIKQRIFERYSRGTDYAGGFGVGLSIVAVICREYDIGIEVDSLAEKGTCFRLFFRHNKNKRSL